MLLKRLTDTDAANKLLRARLEEGEKFSLHTQVRGGGGVWLYLVPMCYIHVHLHNVHGYSMHVHVSAV